MTEIEAIQTIDATLAELDKATCTRVLGWACSKYSVPAPASVTPPSRSKRASKAGEGSAKARAVAKNPRGKGPSIVRELNLRPSGQKDFRAFAAEKHPNGHSEMCTVAVFYLKEVLKIPTVGTDHVFTCYKDAGSWRLPADMRIALALTAHRKGWLDTSDFGDIRLTAHGENLVRYDLPRKEGASE